MIVGKRGDTLIEVALAVGIFSMVAISVAAVLSGSTSGAQTSLETTLAREEIDTQAEALRFIQTAYAANDSIQDNQYTQLWNGIIERAVTSADYNQYANQLNNYSPTSCAEDYNSDLVKNKAFVINPRALSDLFAVDLNQVLIVNQQASNPPLIRTATIYPRLVYGDTDELTDTGNTFSGAEGIYVIAAKDPGTTNIIDITNDSKSVTTSAYYDFYIRGCWYGIDSDQPSTISTVIRLYDPKVKPDNYPFDATLYNTLSQTAVLTNTFSGRILNFAKYPLTDGSNNNALVGWCDKSNVDNPYQCPGTRYGTNFKFFSYTKGQQYNFYSIWQRQYWVDVNVFVGEKVGDTSGRTGFDFYAYIGGQQILCGSNTYARCTNNVENNPELIDFYQQIPNNTNIKFVFLKKDGYYISNLETICNGLSNANCRAEETKEGYVVTFQVNPDSLSLIKDSSGHFAIQIEPIWKPTSP